MGRERQVHRLSLLRIPTCLACNYLKLQSPARLSSAQAARENHPAQIFATLLGEPRPPSIRKKAGRAQRELGPRLQLTSGNFFSLKPPSQMKIAQTQGTLLGWCQANTRILLNHWKRGLDVQ